MSRGEFKFTTELNFDKIGYYKDDYRNTPDPVKAVIEWEFVLEVKEWGIKTAEPEVISIAILFEDDSELVIDDGIDCESPDHHKCWIPASVEIYEDSVEVQF